MKSFIGRYFAIFILLLVSCGGRNISPGGSGLIEATEVIISSEAAGQLKWLSFNEGDQIEINDTIGIIDTTTIILNLREVEALKRTAETRRQTASLAIEQAEFNLELAIKEYERVSELIKTGCINRQQYDQTETAYNQTILFKKQTLAAYNATQAEMDRIIAQSDLLKRQYRNCFPLSPVSGTVVNKYVEVGELIGIGKPLIQVARLDTIWVKVYLPSSDLIKIKLGSAAIVDPEDGRKEPFSGMVSWISDVAEFTPKNVQTKESRADLVYAVKITIPNPDNSLKIGMPVSAKIQ
ncbi:MAG: efflux RND transporter periplasmic adaptor subunit [candidate division Zixibacteria bacterium]|nr:efflux RND transporter periplasmic adaptor subunit [candidate division Zixibacteria bacterium]